MKRTVAVGIALAVVALAGGCKDKYESALDDMLTYIQQYDGVLQGIRDKASLEAAKPELEQLIQKMKGVAKRMAQLPEPPKRRRDELSADYGGKIKAAMAGLLQRIMKLVQIEGGHELGEMFKKIPDVK